MDEEQRMKDLQVKIEASTQDWLDKFAEEEMSSDDILAQLYSLMFVAMIYGFDPAALIPDVENSVAAAEEILKNELTFTEE